VRILLLSLILAASAAAQSDFFPAAVWYNGGKARAPMLSPITPSSERDWRADMAQIRSLGFNTVRVWTEWAANEPREGQYRFENLDLALRLAQQAGLRVIVQIYADSAPEWLGRKFADAEFQSQSGARVHSQSAPGYCFDHPGVRRAMLAYFATVAQHASKSPAFYAYDVWSEPAVMNWALPDYIARAQFCYCPYTQARFREWLKAKYTSVAAINQAWSRTFEDWEEVQPPRFGTILTYTDFVDWRVFIGDKIAQDLKSRTQAVKTVDTAHPVTSHAPNPSPVFRTLADPMDASDDYLMKDAVDYFGTSFYPKLTSPDRDMNLPRRALLMDMVRAVTGDRGFYVGELQAGYGVHGTIVGGPVTSSDLQMQMWGMVARGARAISLYAYYPMSSGYESLGYGLVNLDGSLTERSRAAGETARKIAANADLILKSKPAPAEVAVVFNPLAPLLGGEQAYGDRHSMHRAVAGYHRMFFERNIPVDFPSARELDPAKLRAYKLVIVPYPVVLTEQMKRALEEYASAGGRLFVEARPGWVDENGHAGDWTPVTGRSEAVVLPGSNIRVSWNDGAKFAGMSFEEHRALGDGTVMAKFGDGSPAAVERVLGRGRGRVLGTFAGEPNAMQPVEQHPLGDILTRWAGITRLEFRATPFVELRRMRGAGGEFVFFFNHGKDEAAVEYAEELPSVPKRVRELIGAADVASAKRLDLRVRLAPTTLRVYRVDF
jgi:beta-galactosidase GanA